tara:strand:- start:3889 stop:4431 length:543 start_codon:yes stop_codon:yes gene_type:complete
MKKIKSLCVYCGSSEKGPEKHLREAKKLGYAMSQRKVRLIYGGGRVGVMGAVADAVIENNGAVTGVIPEFLMRHEVGHTGITELEIVTSMHERKARMAELSDGFIVLPGGLGTLEELFEIITWKQLGLHNKPIIVVNIDGYWDSLQKTIQNMSNEGYLRPENIKLAIFVNKVDEVFSKLN